MASSNDAVVQIGTASASSQSQKLSATDSVTVPPARTRIDGTDGPDIILGNPGDDDIFAKAGDDIIFGTTGNDVIDGGDGFDTVDYSNVTAPITLLTKGTFGAGSDSGQIVSIEKIIGAAGQKNAIDSSKGLGTAFIDVDLSANRLTVNNIPGLPPLAFTVENFVDVVGTANADSIVGDAASNSLTGGGGSDTIRGGGGADTLTGTDSTARGVGELDVLTGGADVDRFVLGDSSGSFYKGQGNSDFAQITDFSSGEQIQLGSQDTYRLQRNAGGFDLFTTTSGTQDLVAQVQFSTTTGTGPLSSKSTSSNALAADPLASVSNTPSDGAFSIASGQTLGIFTGV
jgi:Ca2+-binding RTX toxin-like protein